MTSKVERLLLGIGRRFIGGFKSNAARAGQSRYMPHQGEREKARRVRQMGAA